ncbi:hypothetical protein IMW82_00805 [Rhodanobacter sp. B2A1Ga4]|uniref:hypothetical protein n=1 Tax=Rhodanobacter TaxID=75309 RepID=UPI000D36DA1F|nr:MULTISPECIES: hypothetical protein [Rhodanobacter]MBQ4853220.1 hypothetical protein [Rhodanobacter sp. B2A1Ga4]
MNAPRPLSRAEAAALLRDMSEAQREVFASRVAEKAMAFLCAGGSYGALADAMQSVFAEMFAELQAARDGESA